MEREKSIQEISTSLLSPNPKQITTDSPTKLLNNNNNTTNHDRLKRDEWSDGAVSTLLEAYEAKWVLRNRAKLKGQDWEDVAKHVSERSNNTKSPKTQTQCKNKIESMKKRYRSESASVDKSVWPLYSRLELLLRGNGSITSAAVPLQILEPSPAPLPPVVVAQQNSHGSNGGYKPMQQGVNNNIGAKSRNGESEKIPIDDSDSNTPAVYTGADQENNPKPPLKPQEERKTNKSVMKRKRKEFGGIKESIRWLAEVVVKSEQARMETMKEIERMRVEADVKRGEIDLKRTEIIANTQLEIAKLFAKGGIVDSSLRIGKS